MTVERHLPIDRASAYTGGMEEIPMTYWYGSDGTTYAIVRPDQVGDRPRWWIDRGMLAEYQHVLDHGFGEPPREVGPDNPYDLHALPLCSDCKGDDEVVLALVIPDREPGPSDDELSAAIEAALKEPSRVMTADEFREWIMSLPYHADEDSES